MAFKPSVDLQDSLHIIFGDAFQSDLPIVHE